MLDPSLELASISVKSINFLPGIDMVNFHQVDLNLLRVFQAILEERSLTRAGQRLELSQPTISYSLGRLRSLFDDPLFVRTPDGMLPTPTAERLAVPLGSAIASIREALRESEQFDHATTTREFRLSMSDIGEHVFLPPICERLERVAPQVRLSTEQIPVREVEEKMRLGQIDLAIGNLPSLMPVTNHALLFRDQFVCMTRKRPGLPLRALSRQKFLEFLHVTVTTSDSSHLAIDEVLRSQGLHRRIALRVPHFTVVPQILQRTNWMVTLHRGAAQMFNETGQFLIYPMPAEMPDIESTVHWHRNFDNDEGIRWFRELVIDTLHRD
ncbi:LysR family transcriptional regulator [Caballeronia temeraria]|uniref:LysR family transcriptional regulator n=2 Tax=Caballeronia temeraria TaxID=1777137 RepID=A0A158CIK8_9BURK|nr:LysR family transcriptional regulator [Caballeronia temeraria]